MHTDTIFAIATAPGKAGVAVLRISGQGAEKALVALGIKIPLTPRHSHFREFHSEGEIIDSGLVLFFPAPHSFTGENVIELQVHGSRAVLQKLSTILSTLPGFRPAEAGEFTRRAFLNGKLDLAEAEGLADLLDAETEAQRRQALYWLSGEASQAYEHLRLQIIEAMALLEAYLDFPEEDIPETVLAELQQGLDGLQNHIRQLLLRDQWGERLREGFRVVIAGAPNAGKSTLLNALAKRDVAIVSDQAGTTRDRLEVHLDLHGLPVIVTDTAGIHATVDAIEREGIRRAEESIREADLVLLLQAPDLPTNLQKNQLPATRDLMLISTKADLNSEMGQGATRGQTADCTLSAKNPEGVAALLAEIYRRLSALPGLQSHSLIIRERHRQALAEALRELESYGMEPQLELRCERLRLAATALGRVTGKVDVEELLDYIFGRFCIGK
jgi:tRNA modification GTPase